MASKNKIIFLAVICTFILINISLVNAQITKVFTPDITPVSQELRNRYGIDKISNYVRLYITSDFQATTGNVVINKDKLICGDTFKIIGVSPEPKIQISFETNTCPGARQGGLSIADNPVWASIENVKKLINGRQLSVSGTPSYIHSICGPSGCTGRNLFICDYSCNVFVGDNVEKISEDTYRVTRIGTVRIDVDCGLQCILFVDESNFGQVYGYADVDFLSDSSFKRNFEFNVTDSLNGPLYIADSNLPSDVEPGFVYLKINLKNIGDIKGKIDDIRFNADSLVLYKPKSLDSGSENEIIAKVRIDDSQDLILFVDSSIDGMTCNGLTYFPQQINLGRINVKGLECRQNSECGSGLCCEGKCRDPKEGICADLDADGIPEWVPK